MAATYRIGVDVGGTNLAAGILDSTGAIIGRAGKPTDRSMTTKTLASDIFELSETLVRDLGADMSSVGSIGVCVPGTVNQDTGELEYANNLPNLCGDLRAAIGENFGKIPVYLENDANAAALGEYTAQKRDGDFVMVTLGTGVGGGVIIAGKLLTGVNFAAAELGHMTIRYDGVLCSCGRRGCFEMYGSAEALKAQAAEHGMNAPNAKTVFDAYRAGEAVAVEVVDQYITYLAEGITNIINIFQPKTLCIGGGVSKADDILLPKLREKVMPMIYSREAEVNTEIIAATLYNDAGIIGAANLYQIFEA